MSSRIAYLGPAGTFTEQAVLQYSPDSTLLSFTSISAVLSAVESGTAEEGIVPIENSLQGSVTETLDLLIHNTSLFIRRELILAIEHFLMSKPKINPNDIQVIYSHPQALAQCREFLESHFPKVVLVASLSTTSAVEMMQKSTSPTAAIASRRAVELYGTKILAQNIQDNPNNVTRFVVLNRSDHPPTMDDKTSICFSFAEDKPGLLYDIIGEFARHGINLTKVESRPTKQILGQYFFLIDLEGHRTDSLVSQVLEKVRGRTTMLRVLGSYPRHKIVKDK
jgi:prephenate dehydratase